jgi:polynucleotide 5'-kinase involved in rRNA processing
LDRKTNEVVELVHVVANELEVAKLKLDNKNKDNERLCTKMEHINVVHESMTSMKEEKEKKLQALLMLGETDGGKSSLQLVTLDFYRKMVCKQDHTIVGLLVQ